MIHAGATGSQFLYVCRLLVPSATPPTVILNKVTQPADYSNYAAGSGSWTVDQAYNVLIDQVAARFGAQTTVAPGVKANSDLSVITVDANQMGWNPATMISSADAAHVHPNDLGMSCYASAFKTVLNLLPSRKGLQLL